MQPARELVAPLLRVLVCTSIGPLLHCSSDEAFCLAIGTWSVRPGKAVFDAQPFASAGEQTRTISRAVVCQQRAEAYAESSVIGQSLVQEGHSGLGFFIWEEGREGDPGVVIDGDMHVLPAHAAGAVGQVAGNAMAGLGDTAQFLDVQMEHVAGPLVLVTLHRLAGFQIAHAAELEPAQDAADSGAAKVRLLGDPQPGPALPAQSLNQLHLLWPGRPVQPVRPARAIRKPGCAQFTIAPYPLAGRLGAHVGGGCSRRQRATMLDYPSGHLLSTPHRRSGILVIVHLVSWITESSQTQLYRSRSDGQSIETSHLIPETGLGTSRWSQASNSRFLLCPSWQRGTNRVVLCSAAHDALRNGPQGTPNAW